MTRDEMLGIEPPDDGEIVNEEVVIIIIEKAMEREQAIRIIQQLLDEYKENELNWNLGGKQEIYYDVDRHTSISGEAEWEARFETRTVGDEEQPMELLEPELVGLEGHILTYGDEEPLPIKDELITLKDL